MATAGDVIESALKRILVQASDAPLEPDEYADSLEALNNLMLAYESLGIRLGYTEVVNVADEVTVPPGARMGIIANLAVNMASDFGGTVSPSLAAEAKTGLSAMRRLGRARIASSLPGTLPCGSGNDDNDYISQFYEDVSSATLTLSGSARATACPVTDTAYRVAGFWEALSVKGLRGDVGGRVTNVSNSDIATDAKVVFSAIGNSTHTFRLMKNGVSQALVSSVVTSTPVELTLTKLVTLAPGDYLELWAEDDLATEAVTVTQAKLTCQ